MTTDDAHTVRVRLKYADALVELKESLAAAKEDSRKDYWDDNAHGRIIAYEHAISLLER